MSGTIMGSAPTAGQAFLEVVIYRDRSQDLPDESSARRCRWEGVFSPIGGMVPPRSCSSGGSEWISPGAPGLREFPGRRGPLLLQGPSQVGEVRARRAPRWFPNWGIGVLRPAHRGSEGKGLKLR